MANSLQEQLLKAGLTNEKKAKKAKKSNKKNRDLKREVKAAVEEKRQAEQQKAKELNQQLQEQAKQKEIQAQILQLIEMNQLSLTGEVKYNFTDGSKIKDILVDDKTQSQLASGLLTIVRLNNDYAVIPSVVADKIALRDDSCIVSQSEKEEIDEDDPYADYVIPDDLMW